MAVELFRAPFLRNAASRSLDQVKVLCVLCRFGGRCAWSSAQHAQHRRLSANNPPTHTHTHNTLNPHNQQQLLKNLGIGEFMVGGVGGGGGVDGDGGRGRGLNPHTTPPTHTPLALVATRTGKPRVHSAN